MAIYLTPPKSRALERRLTELDELRRYLAQQLGESAQPWTGALRRLAAAEATVGSTSIEGYGASLADTIEILSGGHPAKTSEETQRIMKTWREPVSLDTPIGENENRVLGDILQSGTEDSPSDSAMQGILKE